MANEYNFLPNNANDLFLDNGVIRASGLFEVGKGSVVVNNGAIRVVNVAIPQGAVVLDAVLNIKVGEKGSGSTDLFYDAYGIAEDDTVSFSVNNPLNRSSTSSHTSGHVSLPPVGAGFGIHVESIVNEIVGRGGWVSGNSIGFKIYDNGSANDVWVFNDSSDLNLIYLETLLTTRPNFYPTPGSVITPDLQHSHSSWGVKFAKRGYDVLTASDKQLNFSSRWPILKAGSTGFVPNNVGTKTIYHGLGYKGAFLTYLKSSSGQCFRLPDIQPPFSAAGFSEMDNDNIYISAEGDLYYYVFIDDISL